MAARRQKKQASLLRRWFRRGLWLLCLLCLLLVADGVYLLRLMPDWQVLAKGDTPKSAFIKDYEAARADDRSLPRLRWQPVALGRVPRDVRRAVIVAEDSRFYQHEGLDLDALQEAWEYNLERKQVVYGGSTLSQQLVKNMFLHARRDPLRKWHELWLTLIMEQKLEKRRILELYLNVAEFGRGIYGVEAASRHYWGISVSELNSDQAIELAATLPGPRQHNPATRTKFFRDKVKKIRGHLGI